MQKWEYLELYVIRDLVTDNNKESARVGEKLVTRYNDIPLKKPLLFYPHLQELGDQGWELIQVIGGDRYTQYYFKRPIKNQGS